MAVDVEKIAVSKSKNSAKTSKDSNCFLIPNKASNNTPNPIGICKINGCKWPMPASGSAKLDWKINRKMRKPWRPHKIKFPIFSIFPIRPLILVKRSPQYQLSGNAAPNACRSIAHD